MHTTANRVKAPLAFWVGVVFFILLNLMTFPVSAECVYEDVFDRVGPVKKSIPAPVDGPVATWGGNTAVSGTPEFRTENGWLKIANASDLIYLPYTFSCLPPGKYVLILSCKLVLNSGNGKGWVGIGFSGDNRMFRSGVSWIRIATDGKVELIKGPGYSGGEHLRPSVVLTPDKPAEVKITYETVSNTATFYLNNEAVGKFSYGSPIEVDRLFIASISDKDDMLNAGFQNFKFDISSQTDSSK